HTPTPHIYTLSLHDALPIYSPQIRNSTMPDKIVMQGRVLSQKHPIEYRRTNTTSDRQYYPEHCSYKQLVFSLLQVWIRIFFRLGDRKSTRLNSSHVSISYAV